MENVLKKGPLPVDGATDILALDRASYPRFYDGVRAAKYCVPIQGAFHEKLVPEISFRPAAAVRGRRHRPRAHGDAAPGAHARQHDQESVPVPGPG